MMAVRTFSFTSARWNAPGGAISTKDKKSHTRWLPTAEPASHRLISCARFDRHSRSRAAAPCWGKLISFDQKADRASWARCKSESTVAKPELGTKRLCASCGTKFYGWNNGMVAAREAGGVQGGGGGPGGGRPGPAPRAPRPPVRGEGPAPEPQEVETVSLEEADAEAQGAAKKPAPAEAGIEEEAGTEE